MIQQLYCTSSNPFEYSAPTAMKTDGYHMTTLAIILHGMKNPEEWGITNLVLRGDSEAVSYTVIAGLWELLKQLETWVVDVETVRALKSKNISEKILNMVKGRKFEGNVHAVRDGEVMFSGPIVRFEGPKWQIKWIESVFTNHLRRCSSVATKLTRARSVCLASSRLRDVLLEASLRRSNDTDGIWTARSAYIGSADSTSNVLAGEMFNIPWGGTVDHFTMQVLMEEYLKEHVSDFLGGQSLEDYFKNNPKDDLPEFDEDILRQAQRWAYEKILDIYPDDYTLLVDTINPTIGVEDAIIVLKKHPVKKYKLRIDSGDLAALSLWAKTRLEEENLGHVDIAPSGGLSAITVKTLIEQDCPGSTWMFGEYLKDGGERSRAGATLHEFPVNVEMVSKYGGTKDGTWESIKLSGNPVKNSFPGHLNRIRLLDENDKFAGDVLVNENTFDIPENGRLTNKLRSQRPKRPSKSKLIPSGTKFYVPMKLVFTNGAFIPEMEALYELEPSRKFCAEQMERLPFKCRRVDGTHQIYGVGIEKGLESRAHSMGLDQVISHVNPPKETA